MKDRNISISCAKLNWSYSFVRKKRIYIFNGIMYCMDIPG
jgi:hypothetical protein